IAATSYKDQLNLKWPDGYFDKCQLYKIKGVPTTKANLLQYPEIPSRDPDAILIDVRSASSAGHLVAMVFSGATLSFFDPNVGAYRITPGRGLDFLKMWVPLFESDCFAIQSGMVYHTAKNLLIF
ncbi:MAG: hypothetical protein ACRD7E_06060, partial [Bryobacteraceae bacterium]